MVFYIIGGIILLVIIYIIAVYNQLIGSRNKVKDQASQIDIELQRRFDLIPNLVETVKGYAKHEKNTLEEVINARNNFNNAEGNLKEELEANNQLTSAITKLFALAENYPDLKANTNFLDLQNQLSSIEEQIAYKRSFYNETVRIYNNKIQMFPNNIVASMFNFNEAEFFKINEAEKENVKVKF